MAILYISHVDSEGALRAVIALRKAIERPEGVVLAMHLSEVEVDVLLACPDVGVVEHALQGEGVASVQDVGLGEAVAQSVGSRPLGHVENAAGALLPEVCRTRDTQRKETCHVCRRRVANPQPVDINWAKT